MNLNIMFLIQYKINFLCLQNWMWVKTVVTVSQIRMWFNTHEECSIQLNNLMS